MEVFLYELKEKWDKKYVYIIYFLLMIVVAVYGIFCYLQSDFLLGFQTYQRSSIILFAGMMFLAYEMFCDLQKKDWRELISLKKNGFGKILIAKNILSVLFVLGVFLVVFIITAIRAAKGVDFPVWKNAIRVLFLNFALLPLMGAELGKMFALVCKKRWSGYLGILILILLSAGVFQRISQALYFTVGINLDWIFRFFQFTQPNSDWIPDYLYLIPAESYRFFLFAAWIAGAEGMIALYTLKRYKIKLTATIACGFLCVLCAEQVVNAGNYVNYNLNYGTAASKETEFKNDQLPDEREADFSIGKCLMELTISNELQADVTLEITEENKKELCFTLYRGYEITDISIPDGDAVQWERDKDYITVKASEPIKTLHLSYHGYQQSFYSNRQGIMLPGYFAYYPQAGFRSVYKYQIVDDFQYYGFNMESDSLYDTWYEISINAPEDVVSNLQQTNGIFTGKTKVPTLMGGYVGEENREDGSYIFPATVDISQLSLSEIKKLLNEDCNMLSMDAEKFDHLKYIICLPTSVTIDDTWANEIIVDDCLFVGVTGTTPQNADDYAQEILENSLNVEGEKDFLKEIFSSVLKSGKDSYLWDLEAIDEKEFLSISYDKTDQFSESFSDVIENFTLDRMYLMLLEKFDNTEILQKTAAFLVDNNDQRSSAEFMQDLYRELEEKQNGITNQ